MKRNTKSGVRNYFGMEGNFEPIEDEIARETCADVRSIILMD